ncbi:MAG: GH1 family beta-glucosidase [Trueperaceae bacterium]
MIEFPKEFIWGASTAAYQIEGAVHEDGRGVSIWDTFSHTAGKVAGGDTGDVACDHYHRYREDVSLMARLGIDAYRFSVAWPRVFPSGKGKPNRRGLDFYGRLVDELLERGIEPWVCLYHWDLPQALEDRGGWTARDTVHRFVDYAEVVAQSLGDRVDNFLMLNEPSIVAVLGHLLGIHAPGRSDIAAYAASTHNLNLAAGQGVARLRELGNWRLGTVLNLEPVHGVGEGEQEQRVLTLYDAFRNRNYADPLFLGTYPEATAAMMQPHVRDGDLEAIRQPLDMLGLNLYSRVRVKADPGSLVGFRQLDPPSGAQRTAMNWEVYPDALFQQLVELKERYGNPPVYVTENGAAFADRREPDGSVRDQQRIDFLAGYIGAVRRALDSGVDVRGYFVWSLLDNFEWAEGYDKRFGLVYVDYRTQERVTKASFDWYRETIRNKGFEPRDESEPV